jgi:hypothetical protein
MKLNNKTILVVSDNGEMDIFLLDGGVATIHHNGERFLTTYIQNRATPDDLRNPDFWTSDVMSDSKQYIKDWKPTQKYISSKMILDAARWLLAGFGNGTILFLNNYNEVADLMEEAGIWNTAE